MNAPVDQIYTVSHDDSEWEALWMRLEDKRGCTRELNLDTGEVWEYMVTLKHPLGYIHQFRHPSHPHTGDKIVCNVVASRGWKPDENQPANAPHYAEESK